MYNEGSAEFNELITKSGGNALILKLAFSDFTIEHFTKLEYYGGSNNSDDIAIGTTNMAYLDVSAITDKIITNQEFLLEVGMELSDGTVEYAPIGYFTVQKPDGNEDTVDFTAYDRMHKFEKPYVSSLAYPTDSEKVLNELCAMCGVELATPIASPITITDKLDGYTCREVLGYIAGIHGFFACFDRYGKLNLRWYSETPIEKQIGLIWSLTKSQSDYTVEKIILAKDTETTYTSGTGISGINHSNPYATQAIADSIYASLGGFSYRPCEISMLDDIRLDPWDMLKVTYLDGSVLTIPVMSLEHSFTSGETRVKSFGKTDTENEYSYAGPTAQAIDRMATELLVANRIIATKVDAEWVNAHTVTVTELQATNARVSTLEANSLTAETADLRYANITLANIDTANVDVAKIGLLFTKVGLIDRATIVDGHITGFLDAVEVNANNITAGTLIADRILLKGSESGLLYALNNLGELTSTEVDTLDGTILTQRTVTADKLVANSITANELDVTNIFGNSAVLTTLTSQQAFINAISTNSVVVGANNTANNALDTVNNLSVGDRNLLLATKNFGNITTSNGDWAMSTDDDGFTVASRTGNGNWNALRTITDVDATNNAQSDKQVVITIDAKADDLATTPKNHLIACEVYGSNDGFKTWYRAVYTNCYIDGSGGNLKYLAGARQNNKWCTLSFTMTLDKLTSGSWGTYNEYRYGVAVYTTNNNTSHTISVRKFKMSFSNVVTDWSPAPEDVEDSISKVDTKAQGIIDNIYTTNTTTIDGGKITTGSITADAIGVKYLSAITANLGTVTAGILQSSNYISNNSGIKLNLSDGSWDSKYFKISSNGSITATGGTIGGWTITSAKIYGGDKTTGVAAIQYPSDAITYVFAAGGTSHSDYSDCPFRVTKKGELYAISGTIGGWTISSTELSAGGDGWGGITYDDFDAIRNYLYGTQTLNDGQKEYYDFDGNGYVDINDGAYAKNYLLKGSVAIPNKVSCSIAVSINPGNTDEIIKIVAKRPKGLTDVSTIIGANRIVSPLIQATGGAVVGMLIAKEASISGTLSVSGTATFNSKVTSKKNMLVDCSSEGAVATSLEVKNSVRDIAVHTSAVGNAGLYDSTNSAWIIRCDTDQNVYIPHRLYVPNIVRINDDTSTYAYINKQTTGTTSTVGLGQITAGNDIASGKAGNARGRIALYGTSTGYTALYAGLNTSANIGVYLPSSAGTLALTSSDKRLKENVKDAEVSGLDFINAIKLHQFDWKESGDHWNCGYIADELMEYDEHLVLEGSGGLNDDGTINPLCIDDFYLSAYQTKAIQELYKRIIELEEKIQALKNAN